MANDETILTKAEEVELFRAYAATDSELEKKRIRDKVLLANTNLIRKFAWKYNVRKEQDVFDDLVAEGFIGAMSAFNTFDVEKGFRFSTHLVPNLRTKMVRYLRQKLHIITIPHGKNVNDYSYVGSLDILAEDNNFSPESKLDENHIDERYDIGAVLEEVLTTTEYAIIVERYGLESDNADTLQEIGNRMGVSRERVRQIQEIAEVKLKTYLQETLGLFLNKTPDELAKWMLG
jgi:RNA polymerase sigma factor (sigma-70 family)